MGIQDLVIESGRYGVTNHYPLLPKKLNPARPDIHIPGESGNVNIDHRISTQTLDASGPGNSWRNTFSDLLDPQSGNDNQAGE